MAFAAWNHLPWIILSGLVVIVLAWLARGDPNLPLTTKQSLADCFCFHFFPKQIFRSCTTCYTTLYGRNPSRH